MPAWVFNNVLETVVAQLVPNMGKHSAKRKLVPLPPESQFPYDFLGVLFARRGGTGTTSPVVQEQTINLFLAAVRSFFQ